MKYQKIHNKLIQRMIKKYLKNDICLQKNKQKIIVYLRVK